MSPVTEKETIARLKAGDSAAFALLYDRYKRPLLANLVRMLKSREQAEDVAHDVFLKIWDTREIIDPEQRFQGYLTRIGTNMVYDIFRRAARDRKLQIQDTPFSEQFYSHVEEQFMATEERKLLRAAVELLPSQRRKVYILCKLEGKSYDEVGSILGISRSTINEHLVKANQFLRGYFLRSSLPLVIWLSLQLAD